MDDAETLAALATLIRDAFADEDDQPAYVGRVIVIADATTTEGHRALYTWSPDDMTDWERIGMLEAQVAELKAHFVGIDTD